MNSKTFQQILNNRIRETKDTLGTKQAEYARPGDRLHNFKVAARYDDESPERALWGMLKKHLVSVQDMINDPNSVTDYLINQKIGDAINYFVLLEALFRERIE